MNAMTFAAMGGTLLIGASAHGAILQVQMTGAVEFNLANSGPVSTIGVGETLTYSFEVDSDMFTNSGSFPVRGYEIIPGSFMVTTSGGFSTGLSPSLPATPYFVLRNNDPAVDGFYLTFGGVDFPGGLWTQEPGLFGDPFEAHFSVGYTDDTLNSLDILDATGTYAYGSGGPGTLTNFYFNLVDLGFEVVGVDFQQMSIVPAPATMCLLVPMAARRRRRAAS